MHRSKSKTWNDTKAKRTCCRKQANAFINLTHMMCDGYLNEADTKDEVNRPPTIRKGPEGL